jgi:hypothetical protein
VEVYQHVHFGEEMLGDSTRQLFGEPAAGLAREEAVEIEVVQPRVPAVGLKRQRVRHREQ